jgi:hypothetical protein
MHRRALGGMMPRQRACARTAEVRGSRIDVVSQGPALKDEPVRDGGGSPAREFLDVTWSWRSSATRRRRDNGLSRLLKLPLRVAVLLRRYLKAIGRRRL